MSLLPFLLDLPLLVFCLSTPLLPPLQPLLSLSLSLSLSVCLSVSRFLSARPTLSVNTTNPPAIKHRLARSRFSFLAFFSPHRHPRFLCLCSSFLTSPHLCPATTTSTSTQPTAHPHIHPLSALSTLGSDSLSLHSVLFLSSFEAAAVCARIAEPTVYGSRPVAQQRIINYRRPAARVHPNFPAAPPPTSFSLSLSFQSSVSTVSLLSSLFFSSSLRVYLSPLLVGCVENTAADNSSRMNELKKKKKNIWK